MRRLFYAALLCMTFSVPLAASMVPLITLFYPTDVPTGVVPDSQVFLDNVPDPTVLIGHVSWVWNSNVQPFSAQVPSFSYWPVGRNNINVNNLQCTGCVTGGTNPFWDWFLHNQPTFVEYLNDKLTPAWVVGTYNYVPLAINNPNVFSFVTTGAGSGGATTNFLGLLTTVYAGGLKNAGIALDNVTIENNQYAAGHYTGTPNVTLCTETDPSCGGTLTWVQDFCAANSSITFPYCTTNVDQAFYTATLAWTSKLHQWVNSQGGQIICNNEATSNVTESTAVAMVCGDSLLTEGAWLDGPFDSTYCTGGSPAPLFVNIAHDWLPRWKYYRNVSASLALAPVDYLCGGVNPPNEPQVQVAWGVANFLLDRGGKSWYSARDGVSGGFGVMPAYFNPPCGTAAWTQQPATWSYLNSGGSYERILPVAGTDPPGTLLCYVEVNPNVSISTTYNLPSGTWEDQFGNTVPSGSNTLAPTAGIVIKKVG